MVPASRFMSRRIFQGNVRPTAEDILPSLAPTQQRRHDLHMIRDEGHAGISPPRLLSGCLHGWRKADVDLDLLALQAAEIFRSCNTHSGLACNCGLISGYLIQQERPAIGQLETCGPAALAPVNAPRSWPNGSFPAAFRVSRHN